MLAEDVLELYALLLEHGVQIWLDGGWGIDALLERQTRPHKDLDAFVDKVSDFEVTVTVKFMALPEEVLSGMSV